MWHAVVPPIWVERSAMVVDERAVPVLQDVCAKKCRVVTATVCVTNRASKNGILKKTRGSPGKDVRSIVIEAGSMVLCPLNAGSLVEESELPREGAMGGDSILSILSVTTLFADAGMWLLGPQK